MLAPSFGRLNAATGAAALALAVVWAGALAGAAPKAKAPKKGTACKDVVLPGGTRLPDEPGCRVVAARYTASLAAVVWFSPRSKAKAEASGEERDPMDDVWGVAVEDLAADPPRGEVRTLEGKRVRLSKVGDVTGDGLDDAVFLSGGLPVRDDYYFPPEHGTYVWIWGRRADGFGHLGTHPVLKPRFTKGALEGKFFTTAAAVEGTVAESARPARWEFDGTRFVRYAPGARRVEGVRIAVDAGARAGHPPEHALDGDRATAWIPDRAGLTAVTLTFPRKIRLARFSFSTGWDAISAAGEDLFWAHGRLARAHVEVDPPGEPASIVHESMPDGHAARWGGRTVVWRSLSTFGSARWIDYVPSRDWEIDRLVLVLPARGVVAGTREASLAVAEIEVWER